MQGADATVTDCSLPTLAGAGRCRASQGRSSALAQGLFHTHTTGTGEFVHSYLTSTFNNRLIYVRIRGKRKSICSREAWDGDSQYGASTLYTQPRCLACWGTQKAASDWHAVNCLQCFFLFPRVEYSPGQNISGSIDPLLSPCGPQFSQGHITYGSAISCCLHVHRVRQGVT